MDMESDQITFCIEMYNRFMPSNFTISRFFVYALLALWIVGVLGNLVNIAVFRHKNMAHPINSIFLWLSITDLLELAMLASYQWICKGCGWILLLQYFFYYQYNFHECVLILIIQYLLQVFHTITIGLNIVLAFCQYMVVAYPIYVKQKNLFNNQFIKYTIISTYIFSFVLYLPFWYINVIIIEPNEYSDSIEYRFEWRNNEDKVILPLDSLLYICVLFCGVVLRIGPLIILLILCALLLFAVNNAQRERRKLVMEGRQLSKAERKVNRMNVTIAIVIIMFLITEVPFGISTLLGLSEYTTLCSFVMEYHSLLIVMLLNCSYSIFCYLIRIKEYRETLKLLLNKSNWISSRARVIKQTDLELQTL